jgi:hypothetical protein
MWLSRWEPEPLLSGFLACSLAPVVHLGFLR